MAKDDAQKPKTTTDAKAPVNTVSAPASTESKKPNRKRNRNKKPGGANTATPAQKQPEQKRRLNKDERYDIAQQRSTKAVERIKSSDDDGNVVVRTYGFSYEMVGIADNIALMQEIQNDMANQMKRAVKSFKADKITGMTDVVGLFAAEVSALAEKAQAAVDMFLAEGYGPRYARDAHAKRIKAQKNDEVTAEAAVAAPDAPKTSGAKTAAAAKAAEEVK